MRTPYGKTALAAEQQPGVPSSIDEQQDLFPLHQRLLDGIRERSGEDEGSASSLALRTFLAHIDQRHLGSALASTRSGSRNNR